MFPKSVPHPRLRRAKPPREMPRCWTEDEDENGEGEVKKRAAKRAKNKDADDITSRWTWKRFGQLVSHDSAVRHSATVTIKLPRCEKVFCEKWIHEDTCALTQMGCKYSHPTKVSPVTPVTHQPQEESKESKLESEGIKKAQKSPSIEGRDTKRELIGGQGEQRQSKAKYDHTMVSKIDIERNENPTYVNLVEVIIFLYEERPSGEDIYQM
jgi:hypothetical protein